MELPEEHKELVIPLAVIVLSAGFGILLFFTRVPESVQSLVVSVRPISYQSDQEYIFPDAPTRSSEATQGERVTEAIPAPTAQNKWIVSQKPSTFYVVQETPLYACPDRECDVLITLFPGVFWTLPYTLSPDGWFETNIRGTDDKGFVAVASLSSQLPDRCSLVLPYRVGHIGSRFLEKGYTREELTEFVLAAEKQIEDVIGRNILSYEENAPNAVNFVISHYRDNEPFHRGLHTSDATFPNGVVGEFWIGIYAALFDDVQGWFDNQFIGPQNVQTFEKNYMKKTILHEMVHTTGLLHVGDPTAVMCGEPDCRPAAVDFFNEQLLTNVDITALKSWCTN